MKGTRFVCSYIPFVWLYWQCATQPVYSCSPPNSQTSTLSVVTLQISQLVTSATLITRLRNPIPRSSSCDMSTSPIPPDSTSILLALQLSHWQPHYCNWYSLINHKGHYFIIIITAITSLYYSQHTSQTPVKIPLNCTSVLKFQILQGKWIWSGFWVNVPTIEMFIKLWTRHTNSK